MRRYTNKPALASQYWSDLIPVDNDPRCTIIRADLAGDQLDRNADLHRLVAEVRQLGSTVLTF